MRIENNKLFKVELDDIEANGHFDVPANVTEICTFAFYRLNTLRSVSFPEGLTNIGTFSFEGTNLQSIELPSKLTSLGEGVFIGTGLRTVTIPSGITTIRYQTFQSCTNLKSIIFPQGLTSIGTFAFGNCTNLEDLTIPPTVTSIGEHAFYRCDKLEFLTIPKGVTSIGKFAFKNCANLSSVSLPQSLTKLDPSAFDECYGITSIVIEAETEREYNRVRSMISPAMQHTVLPWKKNCDLKNVREDGLKQFFWEPLRVESSHIGLLPPELSAMVHNSSAELRPDYVKASEELVKVPQSRKDGRLDLKTYGKNLQIMFSNQTNVGAGQEAAAAASIKDNGGSAQPSQP